MDFTYSEEQQMLADSLRRFVEAKYSFAQRRTISGKQGGFDREIWRNLGEMGVLGLNVPEAYGGFGAGAESQLVVQRELGRALVAEPVIPSAVCAVALLEKFGTSDQKQQWLAALADGSKIVTLAWQETGSRYRPEKISTEAVREGDAFVLNGAKTLVWHGQIADAYIVSAQIAGSGQTALFIVGRDASGVDVTAYPTMDGLQAVDLRLKQVRVTADALLGQPGEGVTILRHGLDHGVAALCAAMAGAMERLIEITSDYLRVRHQFGVPLVSFQALQHRVAEMLIQKEQALSMAYIAAQALDEQDETQRTRMLSASKVIMAQAGRFIAHQAVQLHGGMGMTAELEVGDYFKRLAMADVLFGDSDYYLERYSKVLQDE